jgi:hypothetical protein
MTEQETEKFADELLLVLHNAARKHTQGEYPTLEFPTSVKDFPEPLRLAQLDHARYVIGLLDAAIKETLLMAAGHQSIGVFESQVHCSCGWCGPTWRDHILGLAPDA